MRKLHSAGFDTADHLLASMARAGFWLSPNSKILDFGCGAGGLVYRFRDLGYDAYGFDIHPRVDLRDPDDMRFFKSIDNTVKDTSYYVVDRDIFRMDFPDDTFDVVVSTSVIEHVLDLPAMMAE